jgi:hypothetical protein
VIAGLSERWLKNATAEDVQDLLESKVDELNERGSQFITKSLRLQHLRQLNVLCSIMEMLTDETLNNYKEYLRSGK